MTDKTSARILTLVIILTTQSSIRRQHSVVINTARILLSLSGISAIVCGEKAEERDGD